MPVKCEMNSNDEYYASDKIQEQFSSSSWDVSKLILSQCKWCIGKNKNIHQKCEDI